MDGACCSQGAIPGCPSSRGWSWVCFVPLVGEMQGRGSQGKIGARQEKGPGMGGKKYSFPALESREAPQGKGVSERYFLVNSKDWVELG